MKKALLLSLTICLCACLISLTACNDGGDISETDIPCYDLQLSYDGGYVVTFSETVIFTMPDDTDDVKLHLYPNAFSQSATAPIKKEEWDKVATFGGTTVLSVKINRINCDFEISGKDDTILTIPHKVAKGESVDLSISGVVNLPDCTARFGKNDLTTNLTGFYPVLCARKNGEWLDDGYSPIGDPFCLDVADYYAVVDYPSSLVLASPARSETTTENGVKTTVITAERIRDFALVFSPHFKVSSATTTGGVQVNCFSLDEDFRFLDVAVKAIETFSSAFGEYPYDSYTIVSAPINSGGMEYGAFAILSPIAGADVVVHETAHQWWYNVVGNDQVRESWLDEGLTEFSTAFFYSLIGRDDLYSDFVADARKTYSKWKPSAPTLSMTRDVYSQDESDYVALTYVKGVMLFDTLRTLLGDEKLLSALSAYYRDNSYEIATAGDLISAFDGVDINAGGIIRTFLQGKEIVF